MAKENNNNENQSLENLNIQLTRASMYAADHKKAIIFAASALVCVGLFIWAWIYFFHAPRVEKSFEEYGKVETLAMGNDSIAAQSYAKVADNYSGDAGNLAALEAGEHYYALGQYDKALKYLKEFSSKDEVLQCNATILVGDCYVNLKKYNEATEAFRKAANDCDKNPQIAPRALFKEATVYEAQKKYDKALQCYETIKADYPEYILGNGKDMDFYISRAKAYMGK